ncbi:glutamate formimidoyltransferase, partial [Candidatus Bipolaricaulota bacterium]
MIECVANVSEGRDRAAIEKIASAVDLVGARLLDVHSDPDHHRSVFTFAGEEAEVLDAVLSLCRVAAQRIDLTRHAGTHPRMGAIDVVPFVPLGDAAMSDCVRLARRAGAEIAEELGIPVYLYGAAATCEERANLAGIRRGGFERFAEKIGRPGWAPDFGPQRIHPTAGVVAVGARSFLVAYNVVLGTNGLDVAKAVAAAIRERNGGLPGVKALGMSLASRGLAQVSMNLVDITRTTVPEVFGAVQREAARHGVRVTESEIVGLVPRAAMAGATGGDIRLAGDLEAKILEERIASSSHRASLT